jgi:1-deoxy-D-xylulose-5-phosphate reductoisomerase
LKRIAILGSTGSIGTQALNVIRRHGDLFCAEVLCAGSNADLLIEQAREFSPNAVAIADESRYGYVCDALRDTDVKVYAGAEAIVGLMEMESIDMVLAAIVGVAGLRPTLHAI